MRKYRQDINDIIEANRTMLEEEMAKCIRLLEFAMSCRVSAQNYHELREDLLNDFRRGALFPLLTQSMRRQWSRYHCTINEKLEVHGDDDDWEPKPDPLGDIPVMDMPCAIEEDTRMGLYFVGMAGINPVTQQKYFLVKVGCAQNVAERIRQYATTNPMIYTTHCIYPVENDKAAAIALESKAHMVLAQKAYARAQRAREWFYVDEDTYMSLCNQCGSIEGWEELLGVE